MNINKPNMIVLNSLPVLTRLILRGVRHIFGWDHLLDTLSHIHSPVSFLSISSC